MHKTILALLYFFCLLLFVVLFIVKPLYLPHLVAICLCCHFTNRKSLTIFDYSLIMLLSFVHDVSLFLPLGLTASLSLVALLPLTLTSMQKLLYNFCQSNRLIASFAISTYFLFAQSMLYTLSFELGNPLNMPFELFYFLDRNIYLSIALTSIYTFLIQNAFKKQH